MVAMTESPPEDASAAPEPEHTTAPAPTNTNIVIPRESFGAVYIEMVYKGESHGGTPAPETVLAWMHRFGEGLR